MTDRFPDALAPSYVKRSKWNSRACLYAHFHNCIQFWCRSENFENLNIFCNLRLAHLNPKPCNCPLLYSLPSREFSKDQAKTFCNPRLVHLPSLEFSRDQAKTWGVPSPFQWLANLEINWMRTEFNLEINWIRTECNLEIN